MKSAILTCHPDVINGELEKFLQVGKNDSMDKAFEEGVLIHVKDRCFADGQQSNTSTNPINMERKPDAPLYELRYLESIAQNNKQFIRKMITLFSQQAPADVNEIETAFTRKDYPKVRAVAHRMKPSIDNMGINSLHMLIREIEMFTEAETTELQLKSKIRELKATIGQVVEQLHKEILKQPV